MTNEFAEILNANQKKWAHLKGKSNTNYPVFVDDDSDHWFGTVVMPEDLSWQDMPDGLVINGFKYRLEQT